MKDSRLRPEAAGFPAAIETLQSLPLQPVLVAVIDSGVDATHPLLAGRVASAFHVVAKGDDAEVTPVEPGTNNDTYGHGTAVASIVTGIAPNAQIVDIRVLEPGNEGSGEVLLEGLRHALALRCPVVNMSLAASDRLSARLQPLCDRAYRQGQVLVAARRNYPFGGDGYPAEITACIAVDLETTSRFLHVLYHPEVVVEFAAHGEEVRVAVPGGRYTTKTGTSFATPIVSGVCALLLGHDPSLRPFEVKTLLKAYAGG